jgi:threonine aldolase
MHEIVDLRSDTVTQPGPEMRWAMAAAEVGDDVFEEDPTVNSLQARAAELLNKEAALFVPSGTMSNLVAIKTHTNPGDEILLDGSGHSMLYELGGAAMYAGVLTRQYRCVDGVPDPEEIAGSLHGETLHTPRSSLIQIENTHNRAGGAVVPIEVARRIFEIAQEHGARVHVDGARLFNAAIASGTPAAEYAACSDSVTFCLSKGLGCPIGSLLCGSREFVDRARRVRKMLGGGMRQAGMLAGAGLYALDHNVQRLAEDHANARRLAAGIAESVPMDPSDLSPPTNMVYFNTPFPAESLTGALTSEHNVRALAIEPHRVRLVTHLDVDAEDVERAIEAIRAVWTLLV